MKPKEFINKVNNFIREVGVELKKSTWPTRDELFDSTVVVILSVIALAFFVAVSDFVLVNVLYYLL
jgi:preprotein translocase subunit SecE